MACLKLSPEQEEEKKFVSLKHLIDDGRLRAGDKLTFVCEDGQWFGFMGTVERTGAISVEKHNTTDAEGWVINMERFTTSAGPEAVKEYARRNWDTYFTLNNLPRKFNQPFLVSRPDSSPRAIPLPRALTPAARTRLMPAARTRRPPPAAAAARSLSLSPSRQCRWRARPLRARR